MPMSPADREALVYAPFPIVHRHTASYAWAGTLINRPSSEVSDIFPADVGDFQRRIRRHESLRVLPLDELTVLFGGE